MSSRYGTAQQAYDEGRRHGIMTGLEMAARYVAMCKDRQEIAMMLKAAILTLAEPAK